MYVYPNEDKISGSLSANIIRCMQVHVYPVGGVTIHRYYYETSVGLAWSGSLLQLLQGFAQL